MAMDNKGFSITKENESKASQAELEFILNQATILLENTSKSADSVVNRSTILLTILLGLLSSVIGYTFSNYITLGFSLKGSLIITSVYLGIIIIKLYFNLKGNEYKSTGDHPKYLFNDWYFEDAKTDKDRIKKMLLIMIDSYQDRIEHNRSINQPRWNTFGFCMLLSVLIPIVFCVIFACLSWQSLSFLNFCAHSGLR
ncbi:hypothetical protein [Mucilaginibacter sp. UYCu711]|uniref:hypothetical protein n=1 Tax=Mucilaginibacter sp. UYCu711 TaxID=3156339 RepID=UPI003D235D30